MYSKHLELIAFEFMFRADGQSEENVKKMMEIFDQVFELGYKRGKQDALLEAMMGERE